MTTGDQSRYLGNFILDSLPEEDYQLLHPYLKPITLLQNKVIYNIQETITECYFPTTALVSCLHSTSEDETVEVSIIGFEGMLGASLLLNQEISPWQIGVRLTGEAYKLNADSFLNAVYQSDLLQRRVNRFIYFKIVQLAQSAICNRYHALEQRLCRWLLSAQDRTKTPELLLTRDILAVTIGSTRPAVSIVAGTLQSAGLIRAGRGKITILNREEMEEATCECYHVLKRQFNRYLE